MPLIPTNVITGFLGVGKTTAILDLLRRTADNERWAVLVNEYGDVSIDQAILEGSAPANVTVKDVGGGCICCTTAPYLQVALHLLLTEAKPTRLIVETTGLGHPGRLVETLRQHYADRLEVRATLALVGPDDVRDPKMQLNAIFNEQVEVADVLVLNQLDRAKPGDVEAFREWAEGLFPPKLLFAATEQGRLELAWLDLVAGRRLTVIEEREEGQSPADPVEESTPGRPVRRVSMGSVAACGWIFAGEDLFDEPSLMAYLGGLNVERVKGVFRVEGDHIIINRAGDRTVVTPSHYRHDSRVEMIAAAGEPNWDEIEVGLMKCCRETR